MRWHQWVQWCERARGELPAHEAPATSGETFAADEMASRAEIDVLCHRYVAAAYRWPAMTPQQAWWIELRLLWALRLAALLSHPLQDGWGFPCPPDQAVAARFLLIQSWWNQGAESAARSVLAALARGDRLLPGSLQFGPN